MSLEEIFNSKEIDNYLMSHLENSFHSDFISKRKINIHVDEKEMPFILELLNDENKKIENPIKINFEYSPEINVQIDTISYFL